MASRRLTIFVFTVLTACLGAGGSAMAQLVGDEFQVNSFTPGDQYEPAVAGSSAGNFVIVWQSYPQIVDGGSDIFGQRFGTDGSAVGSEFQVNTGTYSFQYFPDVAMRSTGEFVVVWTDGGYGDGDGTSIDGQRFDSAGQAVGSEFQVNSESSGYQNDARVAIDTNGNMTVVWWTAPSQANPNPDGDNSGIFAHRFDANGDPVGSDFLVNEQTVGTQAFPDVDYDSNGNFVVVWQSTQDGSTDIAVRRFAADGTPLGGDSVISTDFADGYPHVSVGGSNNFVVAWHNGGDYENGLDGASSGVLAQRFLADGSAAGPVFQVNTYTTDWQAFPTVGSDADGNFVVAWESYGQVSPTSDIIAQRYTNAGNPVETEFKVDSFDGDGQNLPEMAWIGTDRFAVVWQSWIQDGSDWRGIFGQIIAAAFSNVTCGDPDSNGKFTASDALTALRTAVGTGSCQACVCDVNNQAGVTASDALIILRVAVGLSLELTCPACT